MANTISINTALETLRGLAGQALSDTRADETLDLIARVPEEDVGLLMDYILGHGLLDTPRLVQALEEANNAGKRLRPSECIFAGIGVGHIRLGIGQDVVERLMGACEGERTFDDGTLFRNFYTLGTSFKFRDGRLTHVFFYSDRKGGYETGEYRKHSGVTTEGVSLDSAPEQVFSAYGQPRERGDMTMAPVPSYWLRFSGIGFDFISETHEMIYMSVGR